MKIFTNKQNHNDWKVYYLLDLNLKITWHLAALKFKAEWQEID